MLSEENQGSGFRLQGLGCRVQDSGFRVEGSGFRVVQGLKCDKGCLETWYLQVRDATRGETQKIYTLYYGNLSSKP